VTRTGEWLSDPKTAGPLIGVVNLPYPVCASFVQTEEAVLVDGDADLPYAAGTETICSTPRIVQHRLQHSGMGVFEGKLRGGRVGDRNVSRAQVDVDVDGED
jgi:hypothetical protein